jgi:Tfp pilus assembly protein PilF
MSLMTILSGVLGTVHDLMYRVKAPRQTATGNIPGDSDLRYSIASIHFEQGRLDEAACQLEAVLATDPRQPEARYLLGCIREEQGQYAVAEKEYRRAIRLDAGRLMYHLRLGAMLEERGTAAH